MSKRIFDVSIVIYPEMIPWPVNPPVTIDTVKAINEGSSSNVSLLHIGTHTATHVDAPRHFIPGVIGIDGIQPDVLLGTARRFQLPDTHQIDREILQSLDLRDVTRILLGTRNSLLLKQGKLDMDYTFVTEDAANFLIEKGIELVGVDYLSIEEYQKDGRPAHNILLGAGVVIVEGLNLADVPPGDYELACLPLKIKDADGAPARVFLREI
jgi:arylformamidase